jgi:hypothetical protein
MSDVSIQALLVGAGAVVMFSIVFALSRGGLLSLRYALGWMAVSVLLAVAAIVIGLIGGIGKSLPFSPTGLIAVVGLGFLTLIALQLSISLSGHQEAIRELSEANALLEERVARVEQHERERTAE